MTALDHAIRFLGLRACEGLLSYGDWHRGLARLAWELRLDPEAAAHLDTLKRVGRPEVARAVWRRRARGDQ